MQNENAIEHSTPAGERWFWSYFFVGFVRTLVGIVVLFFAWMTLYCYVPIERHYTKIIEQPSPDGKKIALVFRQDAFGTDPEQDVRIISMGERFVPQGSSNRAQPKKGLPEFEFSVARSDGVQVTWKDNSTVMISYPLSAKTTPSYQRPRGYSTDVRIEYSPEGLVQHTSP